MNVFEKLREKIDQLPQANGKVGRIIVAGVAIGAVILIFGGYKVTEYVVRTPNASGGGAGGTAETMTMGTLFGNSSSETESGENGSASTGNGKTAVVLSGGEDGEDAEGSDAKGYNLSQDQSLKMQMTDMNTEMNQMKSRLAKIEGEDGTDGKAGKDGAPGKDGKDGKDGRDGIDGKNGEDGKPGRNGYNGVAGKDGEDGKDGKDGSDGENGRDGVNGADGADGADGRNVFIKFSDNADGTGMTSEPGNKRYMGVCNGDYEIAPTDPSKYQWTKISDQTAVFTPAPAPGEPNKVQIMIY